MPVIIYGHIYDDAPGEFDKPCRLRRRSIKRDIRQDRTFGPAVYLKSKIGDVSVTTDVPNFY